MLNKELLFYILSDYIQEGGNYLNGYFALVLYSIDIKNYDKFCPEMISNALSELGPTITIAACTDILDEMVEKDILYVEEFQGRQWYKQTKGRNSKEFELKKNEFQDALNSFCASLTSFLSEEKLKIKVDGEKLRKIILEFLDLNLDLFLINNVDEINNKSYGNEEFDKIALYVIYAFENNIKETIEYLNKIVQGISCFQYLFYHEETESKDLSKVSLFLDTPLIIYALGYTGEGRKKIILELFNQLKSNNAQLYVYEHTVQEVINNLVACSYIVKSGGYGYGEGKYTVEYFLSLPNSNSEIEQAIHNIREDIEDLEISIFDESFYDKEKYKNVLDEKGLNELLAKKMGNDGHGEESVYADTQSLVKTKMLREGTKSKFLSESIAVFITKSRQLVYWAYKFFNETKPYIPSAITHCQLSTRLLLLNGLKKADLPLSILVENCYAAIFPNDETWGKYIKYLNKDVKEKKITENRYMRLRTVNTIQKELKKLEINKSTINAASFQEIVNDDEKKREKEIQERVELEKGKSKQLIDDQTKENERLRKEIDGLKNTDESRIERIQNKAIKNINLFKLVSLLIYSSIFISANIVVFVSNLGQSANKPILILGEIILFVPTIVGTILLVLNRNKKRSYDSFKGLCKKYIDNYKRKYGI